MDWSGLRDRSTETSSGQRNRLPAFCAVRPQVKPVRIPLREQVGGPALGFLEAAAGDRGLSAFKVVAPVGAQVNL